MGPRQSKIIVCNNIIYCKYCNKKILISYKEKICDICKEELIRKRLKNIGFI